MDPQLQALLDQLKDVHQPQATVSWWPPAPGWWLLAALLILAIVLLARWLVCRHRANAFRREGLTELERIYRRWQQESNAIHFLEHSAGLMRRLALYRQGRRVAAPLTGDQWRAWLLSSSTHGLSDTSLSALSEQQYRPNPSCDVEALYQDLRQHIEHMEAGAHA